MNRVIINADTAQDKISRHIYGHFIEHLGRCVYEGLWVGRESEIPNTRGFRNDVVAALKNLNIPNLRWPGGCFADTYHWKDGIGPYEKRPSIVNIHWGGTTENNHCGTHEFFDLCEQLGTMPYVAGNVGSGTVKEMAEWLEYITMPNQSPMADERRRNGRQDPWPLKFWGVGNENWGCGGNMRAEYYADLYRQYASYCRHFTQGQKLYKVACGFLDEWNEVLMREAARFMDGLSVHYYTVPGSWDKKGSAIDFTVDEWKLTMQRAQSVDSFLRRTSSIMDRYDPAGRVGIVLDEWGTWFDVELGTNPGFLYQQNTMRDALVAGLSFNVFHRHAKRLHIANIAQTVNVLQAMVLTEGSKMVLTPTYHVFEMFKVHQDATALETFVDSPEYVAAAPTSPNPAQAGVPMAWDSTSQISASASRDENDTVNLSLCNLHHDEGAEVNVDVRGAAWGKVNGRILTAPIMNAMNTFDSTDAVKPVAFDAFTESKTGLTVALPPRSVVVLQLR